MNLGELITEVRDLGFEEDETLEEESYRAILVTAANRALKDIAVTIPVVKRYEFEQDGTETGVKRYDMIELTAEDGVKKFFDFDEVPVRESDSYDRFNDFEIEEGHIMVMDASLKGKFSVFYKLAPTKLTTGSLDSQELDINLKAEHLLPLLVSYYVWLDDDVTKAQEYKTNYEMGKAELSQSKARLTIRGGI